MKPLEIIQNALVASLVFPPIGILAIPLLLISRNFETMEQAEEYTEEIWNATL